MYIAHYYLKDLYTYSDEREMLLENKDCGGVMMEGSE